MLSVSDARNQILAHCRPLPAESLPLGPESLGRVLAERIVSDIDLPPFDKALMDGYAVRSADLPAGKGRLDVVGEICAGQVSQVMVGQGQAVRIMTGAPIPPGADAVTMVEHTRLLDDGCVGIDAPRVRHGQHILALGAEMRKGDVLIQPGSVLRPQEFGILAAVGRPVVLQVPPVRVALISTGNELIEPDLTPGPGQIRNSNALMLMGQVTRAGGQARYLGIARDDPAGLRSVIRTGLQQSDVLILSGGVSAGKLDLVPDLLREEGVEQHFHKVHLKPGKPLLFGTWHDSSAEHLVFGLPGNPVSSFVCFELFVRPALRCLAGHREVDLPKVSAVLAADFSHRSDRPTYHPARLEWQESVWRVQPLAFIGSWDLRALLGANALLVLPAGEHDHRAGAWVDVLRLGE